MVPLRGLNRALAAHGIKALENSERPGLLAFRNVSGVNKVSCTAVGFNLGPRINAAGRMADGAAVIDLFTTSDTIKARQLAEKLERLNLRRQKTEEEIKGIAVAEVESSFPNLPEALVVANPQFHTGVIGIVAQRLVEIYNRPTVVLGLDNGIFKGSVRGCLGFDVVDALKNCSSHLLKYGGHKAAGGCSLAPENLQNFKQSFLSYAKNFFTNSDFARLIEADTEAQLSEISLKSVSELQRLAPFGLGHPAPRILLRGLVLSECDVLKGKHLKLVLHSAHEGMSATALMWNTKSVPGISKGERVNIVARPEINSFRGQVSLQLQLLAIEPSLV
jgi:single-stranded-DNA-specific exonuclease